jgi:predicted regulator of Ras-like GTPase activity (Roadblock/LC7/MglB family)/lipopolysaccharide biosynthesis regulator YciM
MAFEAEIKELQKKVAQNPASLVFAPLADTLRKAGRLDEAVDACLAGLEHNPSYMTARIILGRTYAEKGMLDEAIAEFKKITLADAGNIMAHSMLGQMYTRRSQFSEAIEEYQRVLALNPDDAGTQAALEEALSKARELPGAEPSAEAPAKKEPAPSSGDEKLATITVAEIYIKKGDLDEAVEVFREILQADPGNKTAKAKLEEIMALKEKKGREESEASEKRKAEDDGKKKAAEAEERRSAEAAEQKRRAEEAMKRAAAAAEEKRKAAEAEEKRKAEEAEEKRRAEEAEEKRKAAEAEEKRRAEEAEEKRKAEEAEEKRRAEEAEEKRKAEEAEKKRRAEEAEEKRKAEEAERKRKDDEEGGEKITAEDIFSVMKMSSPDEVIDEDNSKAQAAAPAKASMADEALVGQIHAFAKANGILASLLVARDGGVMDAQIPSGVDGKSLGQLTAAIFGSTERAVSRMRYGSLNQLIITGEDGRQILFVQLKQGVLAALTDKNVNLGLLRIALHDLLRKAQG